MEKGKTSTQTLAQEFRDAARRLSKPSVPPDDGWPILEKTIPMPEMGIGIPEFVAARREKREEQQKRAAESEQKQRDIEEATRRGIDAETFRQNSNGWGRFLKMSERAREAAIRDVEAVQAQVRKAHESDQGFSM